METKLLSFLVFSQFLHKINKLTSFICGILLPRVRHAPFFSKMVSINNVLWLYISPLPDVCLTSTNLMRFSAVFLSVIWNQPLQFYYFSYRMNNFYMYGISFFLFLPSFLPPSLHSFLPHFSCWVGNKWKADCRYI